MTKYQKLELMQKKKRKTVIHSQMATSFSNFLNLIISLNPTNHFCIEKEKISYYDEEEIGHEMNES